MTMSMWLGMASILVGFIFFGIAFYAFHAQKSKAAIISLFSVAIVFMTIVPVVLAVFFAALNK